MRNILMTVQLLSFACLAGMLFEVFYLPFILILPLAALSYFLLPVTLDQGVKAIQGKNRKMGIFILLLSIICIAFLWFAASVVIGLGGMHIN